PQRRSRWSTWVRLYPRRTPLTSSSALVSLRLSAHPLRPIEWFDRFTPHLFLTFTGGRRGACHGRDDVEGDDREPGQRRPRAGAAPRRHRARRAVDPHLDVPVLQRSDRPRGGGPPHREGVAPD